MWDARTASAPSILLVLLEPHYNGKYTEAEKQLAMQGRKAVFALNRNINGLFLNNETLLSLFDYYICTILNYASAIWGSHKGQNVEKVQLDFCKNMLGVKRTTCNIMIYSELGLVPLNAIKKLYMLKYWGKLLDWGKLQNWQN